MVDYAQHDQWQDMVQRLLDVHRPKQAEALVRRRLVTYPQEAFAHLLLAVALLRQLRVQEAYVAVQQSIGFNPHLSEAHYLLSMVLMHRSQTYAALQALREALRLNSYSEKYLGYQAFIFNIRLEPEKALQSAEAGLRLNPTHIECLIQQIQALQRLRQPERARFAMEHLLESYPLLPAAHLLRGEDALLREDLHGAESHFREALRRAPDSAQARGKLLSVLLRLGEQAQQQLDIPAARRHFEAAWQLEPDNARAYAGLVQCIKYSFRLNRLLHRLNAYMSKKHGLQLLLAVPIGLLCVPIIALYIVAALQWRLHPDIKRLPSSAVFRKPSIWDVVLTGLLCLVALVVIVAAAVWIKKL